MMRQTNKKIYPPIYVNDEEAVLLIIDPELNEVEVFTGPNQRGEELIEHVNGDVNLRAHITNHGPKGSPPVVAVGNYPQYLIIGDGMHLEAPENINIFVNYHPTVLGDDVQVSLNEFFPGEKLSDTVNVEHFVATSLVELAEKIVDSGVAAAKYEILTKPKVLVIKEHSEIQGFWYYTSYNGIDGKAASNIQENVLQHYHDCEKYMLFDEQTGAIDYTDNLDDMCNPLLPDLSEELDDMYHYFKKPIVKFHDFDDCDEIPF